MASILKNLSGYHRMFGLRGLFFAVQNKILAQPREVIIKNPGIAHPLILRLKTSDISTYEKVFDGDEYNLRLVRHPRTIIDAGANIGMASIYFANRYPEATIIAIEPEQRNFELLTRNVAPYPKIHAIRAALWSHTTVLQLVDPGIGAWGFRTTESGATTANQISHDTDALTIDGLMQRFSLDHIDLLKIDIEGAEKEVFKHAGAWIESVDVIVTELHEKMNPGCYRSFYPATAGFAVEWPQGENVCLARRRELLQSAQGALAR